MAVDPDEASDAAPHAAPRERGAREDDPFFDVWLRRGLQSLYDAVVAEPVPDSLIRLIEETHAERERCSLAAGRHEGDGCAPRGEKTPRRKGCRAEPRHSQGSLGGDRVVHMVDQDGPCRDSVTASLQRAGIPARTYGDGDALLHALAAADRGGQGCVLMALRMPGLDELELLRGLRELDVLLPVLVMSRGGDAQTVSRVMRAGAVGYLEDPLDDERLLAAVRNALDTAGADRAARAAARIAVLSPREREVLALLMAGKPNKLVGNELGLDLQTIKAHRVRLMAQLEVNSLAEAAQLAAQAGLA